MIDDDDLPEIESQIRTALRRAGVKRRVVEARMQRIVRAASTIMDPRLSFQHAAATISVADLYAALLMVAVADTFRDGEQPGIVGDFFHFTEEDVVLLQRVFVLLHERYFGFPPAVPEVSRR
ncbi:MAG TPA: hypothetical protein VF698_00490 [Thermoanaerobaculia bacterium]|jgi:hypothetical protein